MRLGSKAAADADANAEVEAEADGGVEREEEREEGDSAGAEIAQARGGEAWAGRAGRRERTVWGRLRASGAAGRKAIFEEGPGHVIGGDRDETEAGWRLMRSKLGFNEYGRLRRGMTGCRRELGCWLLILQPERCERKIIFRKGFDALALERCN